jgi:hypothetical protein
MYGKHLSNKRIIRDVEALGAYPEKWKCALSKID